MIPTRIGQKQPGGRFTGINRIGNDVYAILIAPKWTETNLTWKTNNNAIPNTRSMNDGLLNTREMDAPDYPAAQYCLGLVVDGCSDYYLLASNELEMCYRNLKPVAGGNSIRKSNKILTANGINRSSIPTGVKYTNTNPEQTIVTAFCAGNSEAFESNWYWTSTSVPVSTKSSFIQYFGHGKQSWEYKIERSIVRAGRRIHVDLK